MEILSYEGVDNMMFGATPSEVELILGKPDIISRNYSGERKETRKWIYCTYSYGDQKLVEIGFGRNFRGLTFQGLDILTSDEFLVIKTLSSLDGSPFECLGLLIFLKLGITLGGFHDKDIYQKAVTVFARGRWESEMKNFRPYRIANSAAMAFEEDG